MSKISTPEPTAAKTQQGCGLALVAIAAVLAVVGILFAANHIRGRVVDQNGKPVPHAKVAHCTSNWLTNEHPTYSVTESDVDGNFSTFHLLGPVYVSVSKGGYYSFTGTDTHRGSHGTISLDQASRSSTADPILFRIYKQGELEPLIKVSKSVSLADDGTPQAIELEPKGSNQAHQILARVWSKAKARKEGERYFDWRVEFSVPGGGLQNRSGDFNFTAPEAGYHETEAISFSANSPNQKSAGHHSYFVKLSDDTYARIDLRIHDVAEFFIGCESYFNPKTGSRNLEKGAP